MRKVIFLLITLGFLAVPLLPAGAQDSDLELSVQGTIQQLVDGGDAIPFAGVEIRITSADGSFDEVAVSGDDGMWFLELPAEGEYTAAIQLDSLPDGATIREGANTEITFEPQKRRPRTILFPLVSDSNETSNDIQAVQLFVDGIKLGLIIGMSAIGLSLIFGTTGLVNFAHGEMVTFGAIITYLLSGLGIGGWTMHLLIAAPLVILLSGVMAGVFDAVVWKPLRNRGSSLISMLVVSIGLSILFRYVYLFFFGGRALFYPDFQVQDRWDFGPFSLAPKDVVIICLSIFILVMVGLLLQGTRIGKAMRAVADNRDLASSSGIDVERVIRVVWIAGGALAGMGGILFGLTESVGWEMGFRLLLLMFAGVTLGGLGTAYGALLGSLLVGIFIQLSTLVDIGPFSIPPDLKNLGALVMLAVVLLARPQGLLGRAERVG